MRGDMLFKILGFLENQSAEVTDLFGAFLDAGYGASMGRVEHKYRIRHEKRYVQQINRDKKRHLQKYLFKLKTDGLILENASQQIKLSAKGAKKLGLLKKNRILDRSLYKKEIGDRVIIISYDIPVYFNRERNTLRDILRILGFKMVHKSVWIGKVKIPKQFIVALEKFEILKYVEILEVTKNGSLKEI